MTEIGKRLHAEERIAAVLSEAAEAAKEPALRSEILMLVAELCESMLADLPRAERVYKAALAIDPQDAKPRPPPRARPGAPLCGVGQPPRTRRNAR